MSDSRNEELLFEAEKILKNNVIQPLVVPLQRDSLKKTCTIFIKAFIHSAEIRFFEAFYKISLPLLSNFTKYRVKKSILDVNYDTLLNTVYLTIFEWSLKPCSTISDDFFFLWCYALVDKTISYLKSNKILFFDNYEMLFYLCPTTMETLTRHRHLSENEFIEERIIEIMHTYPDILTSDEISVLSLKYTDDLSLRDIAKRLNTSQESILNILKSSFHKVIVDLLNNDHLYFADVSDRDSI